MGRIVIQKEIRRTLRIRESDPLEIFTDREGEIILKKYSPIGEMNTFAKQYAESLSQASGRTALIADRDQFIAVSGGYRSLLGKSISKELEEKLSAPVEEGQQVGRMVVTSGGEVLTELPLVADRAVARLTYWQILERCLRRAFLGG